MMNWLHPNSKNITNYGVIVFYLTVLFSVSVTAETINLSEKLQEIELAYKSDSKKALELTKTLAVDFPDNAKVIAWLGRLYPIFSEFELGYQYATKALTLNISAYDQAHMAITLGYYYSYKQNTNLQLENIENAVLHAKQTEDPELIVEMLSLASEAMANNNRIDRAMEYMTQSYELVDSVSNPITLSTMYNSLCSIYLKTGHPDGAIEAMLKSIEYVIQANNIQQLAVVYYNLADIYIKTEDFDQAINAYKNSEKYSIASGDTLGVAYAFMGMGRSYLRAGQYQQALAVLLDAKERFLPENHIVSLIQIYGDLASTQLHLKMYNESQTSLKKLEALKPYKTDSSFDTYVQSIETQANVLFALNKFEQAFEVQKNYIEQLSAYHQKQLDQSSETVFEKLTNSIYAKDNQLLLLENKLKRTELDKHKKQFNLLLITAIFSICIAVFVTIILSRNIKLQKQLDKLATTDELTSLFNRRKIMAVLSDRFIQFKKSKSPLFVCMFDLDLFKNINDQYGHVMGDMVLKSIADAANHVFGNEQPVGRYGGEEFLVILNSENYQSAYAKLETFRAHVENMVIEGLNTQVTISLGLSEASSNDAFQTDIIQRADTALYDAKKSGRNRLCGK